MCLFLPRPERNCRDFVKLNNTSLFCYYRNHKTEIRTSHLSGLLSNWAMPCQWFCQEMNCILLWIILLILIIWLIKKSHCALASQSGSKWLLKKKTNKPRFQDGERKVVGRRHSKGFLKGQSWSWLCVLGKSLSLRALADFTSVFGWYMSSWFG